MAKAGEWSKRVAAWRASGQTAVKYAEGRGFAPGTLRWWASRLECGAVELERLEGPEGRTRFARVERAPRTNGATVVVEIGEARVLVSGSADREALKAVFQALSARGAS